jgi:hypothetical protein
MGRDRHISSVPMRHHLAWFFSSPLFLKPLSLARLCALFLFPQFFTARSNL